MIKHYFFVLRGEQHVEPQVNVAIAVFGEALLAEARTAAQDRTHSFDRSQHQLIGAFFAHAAVRIAAERSAKLAAPTGEQHEQVVAQVALQQAQTQLN